MFTLRAAMRLFASSLFALTLALALPIAARADDLPQPPALMAHAWLLTDIESGQAITGRNDDERAAPASLTKLMTAYLVFSAMKSGALTADHRVTVSEHAWKQGGSRMFLQPGKPVTVGELLRGLIVLSGNDAAVALAETVAGSEEAFVEKMNSEAASLGMKDTHFANATGWSDPQHYSTARDLTTLAIALLRDFPGHFDLYSTKTYGYNGIMQQNRNRLLWLDPHVDGIKTGYTEKAGYCIIATANRNGRRLLAVVLGAGSDGARAREAQTLLNYGYQAYDSVRLYEAGHAVGKVRIWKGADDELGAGVVRDLYVTFPRGWAARLTANFVSVQPIVAPVAAGQRVGTIRLLLDGKPFGEYPVVALANVPVAGFFKRTADSVRLWLK